MKQDKFETNKISINPISFEYKKSEMDGATQVELDKVIGMLNSDDKMTVELSGYTELKGATSENKTLSLKRVEGAKKYLTEREINTERITIKGLGEDKSKGNTVEIQLFTTSYKALEEKYNKENPLTLKITIGNFEKGDNPILDDVKFEKGETTLEKEGRKVLVIVDDIIAPSSKTLIESRGLVISDYQNHLEKEWVKELKTKYPVVVTQEEVNKLIKE